MILIGKSYLRFKVKVKYFLYWMIILVKKNDGLLWKYLLKAVISNNNMLGSL